MDTLQLLFLPGGGSQAPHLASQLKDGGSCRDRPRQLRRHPGTRQVLRRNPKHHHPLTPVMQYGMI